MLVRVEIVTPRSGDRFISRLMNQDPTLDHLCLELVHWGFNELMEWIDNFFVICDNNPELVRPAISVHGFPEEVTNDMKAAIDESGALWFPRTEKHNMGKDCGTIIREMVACRAAAKKPQQEIEELMLEAAVGRPQWRHDPDIETYRELPALPIVAGPGKEDRALPDDEFEDLLRQTMKELNRD